MLETLKRFLCDLVMKMGEQKQKQQMNGNRAIWLVHRKDTNARSFVCLSERSGEKLHARELF